MEPGTVTRAVNALGSDGDASEEVVARVYEELRRVAASQLRHHNGHPEAEPAALVNEVLARMIRRGHRWANREHFYRVAARAMRHFVVDQARRRHAAKRGGGRVVGRLLDDESAARTMDPADLVQLDDALHELAEYDGRMCEVVMMRFFAGRSVEDTATFLGISERTVKRDWDFARAWLYKRMSGDDAAPLPGPGPSR